MRRLTFLSVLLLALAGSRTFGALEALNETPASVDAGPPAIAESAAPRVLEASPEAQMEPLRAEATPVAPEVQPVERATPAPAEPSDPDVATILAHLRSRHTGLAQAELAPLAELIVSEARRHGISPGLALAVIRVESGCFNYAVSNVGAMGLMQLMPATGEELAHKLGLDWRGPDSLFDPRINVRLGLAYLKQLSDRFGSTDTALAAYNWGPGRIGRRLRRGQSVPKLYATQVMKRVRRSDAGTS